MKLWFSRGSNLLKIIFSYLISRISGRVIHWGNPVAVSIEPNNTCNLRCPECPAGLKELTRARGHMQPELFNAILQQMLPHLSWLTLYFQGEPFMSRNFFDFVATARSRKIFVATSTNGHFLDEDSVSRTIESGLNRLIISLDGAGQQSYEAYRQGGDFNRVISGIRQLVKEKKRQKSSTPEIILQCLVLKSNEHELEEIRKLGKSLGVNKVTFKTAQFNDFENGNPLMPENQKYSRYKQRKTNSQTDHAGKEQISPPRFPIFIGIATSPPPPFTRSPVHPFTLKNPLPNACFRMWSSSVITWDGKVVPCCFDKDASHELGDLTLSPFAEVWRSKPYDEFRKKILKNRKSIEICSNCTQTF